MVWAEAIEDSVDADARADRAEDAMVEIQRLIPAGGMIRVSDLTKIMEIIKAYKEAKNE
jgi:hypothetical protein